MAFTQRIEDCFASRIGAEGAENADYEALLAKAESALADLRERQRANSLPMLNLPERTDDLADVKALAQDIRANFRHFVVLGTGGSSLGGQALTALTQDPFAAVSPRQYFVDNIDPHTFERMLDALPLRDTFFLVVSKSGGTAETLAQFLALLAHADAKLGGEFSHHVAVVTIPGDNPLRRIAQSRNMRILDHDPAVGGRFSVLSLVGLIPAAVAGVDIDALRRGAADALRNGIHQPARESEAARGAALSLALMKKGKTITVLMPYVDRLSYFGLWYRQLWAESVGKEGFGTTPVRAMGTVDQHSQLQLYLDGPADKFFTFIMLDTVDSGPRLDVSALGDPRLDYLHGATMGDLNDAEQRATAQTLIERGLPVRTFWLDALDAYTLGGLLMHYMLETVIAAALLGIDAYDQPAVEQGKVLAREYLSAAKTPDRARAVSA